MLLPHLLSCPTRQAFAREIVFPPPEGVDFTDHANAYSPHSLQYDAYDGLEDENFNYGKDYLGLLTYANLPHAKCFNRSEQEVEYDVAVMGAPFDTVGLFLKFIRSLFVF